MPPHNFFYRLLMRQGEKEQGHLEAQLTSTEFKMELNNQTAHNWRESMSQNVSTSLAQMF